MKQFLTGLLVFLCFSSAMAQSENTDYYVLYSLQADVDNDGVAERLVMVAYNRPDPTQQGDKAFWVLKRHGEKYRRVFDSGRGTGAFDNRMAMWQILSPESTPPGISVIRDGKGYPMIRVCFTPNSDNLIDYRYNGHKFVVEYPRNP